MNTTVLHLSRPWPQRLMERVREFLLDHGPRARPRATSWHELDLHALRDLGIDASEVGSISAEAACQAAPTRRRIVAGGFRG